MAIKIPEFEIPDKYRGTLRVMFYARPTSESGIQFNAQILVPGAEDSQIPPDATIRYYEGVNVKFAGRIAKASSELSARRLQLDGLVDFLLQP